MILAAFNITKARDEHGNIVEPELEWSGTIRFEDLVSLSTDWDY